MKGSERSVYICIFDVRACSSMIFCFAELFLGNITGVPLIRPLLTVISSVYLLFVDNRSLSNSFRTAVEAWSSYQSHEQIW